MGKEDNFFNVIKGLEGFFRMKHDAGLDHGSRQSCRELVQVTA